MVIGKRAGLEFVPQLKMAQLDFRAEADVAGEQAQATAVAGSADNLSEELQHPAAHLRLALRDDLVQPENVTVEEMLEILRRRRDVVETEKFAHQIHIRAPGEIDFFNAVQALNSVAKSLQTP